MAQYLITTVTYRINSAAERVRPVLLMVCLSVSRYHLATKIAKLFDNVEPFEAIEHSLTNKIQSGEPNRPRVAALSHIKWKVETSQKWKYTYV